MAVGLFALFDVRQLDNRALHVHHSETPRPAYLKSLKRAQKQYDASCDADAQKQVGKVRNGDLSFLRQMRSIPLNVSAQEAYAALDDYARSHGCRWYQAASDDEFDHFYREWESWRQKQADLFGR